MKYEWYIIFDKSFEDRSVAISNIYDLLNNEISCVTLSITWIKSYVNNCKIDKISWNMNDIHHLKDYCWLPPYEISNILLLIWLFENEIFNILLFIILIKSYINKSPQIYCIIDKISWNMNDML